MEPTRPVKAPSFFSFSLKGRYGRLNYLNAFVVYLLIAAMFVGIVAVCWSLGGEFSRNQSTAFYISFLVIFIATLRAKGLRLHDLDLSALWALPVVAIPTLFIAIELYQAGVLIFGPLFILLVEIFFMALPGFEGENSYGAVPRIGKITGVYIFFLIMVVFSLLVFRLVFWI